MKTKRPTPIPSIAALLLSAQLLIAAQSTLVDKIIAQVGDQIILHSELLTAHQEHLRQGGQDTPDLKTKILEIMLLNKLMISQAKNNGITATNQEVQHQVQQKMHTLITQAGSEAALVQHLGKPLAAIRSEIQEKLREQHLADRMRAQIIKDITITPQEVKTYYKNLPTHERPYYPAEVEIWQIVQHPTISQQETEKLTQQLQTLKKRIQDGESFTTLAKKYSQDPGTAPQGGELGYWRLGELNPTYEATTLALKPNEISDPITTPAGLHIIQHIDRHKDQYNSRHILLKPNPKALDLEAAKTRLAQLRTEILTSETTFEQAAKKFATDTTTSTHGQLLTGAQGTTRMPIDKLPTELYFATEDLLPGTITEPTTFTTPDQQQAVRLLYVKEKIAPHQANLAQDYDKLQQLLINEKRMTALRTWFDDTKANTTIKVAPEYQQCDLLK